MKKIILIAVVAMAAACNNQKSNEVVTESDTMATNMRSDSYSTTNAYIPAEGDVIFRDGKIRIWRDNTYVETTEPIEFENGLIVKPNGEVVRKSDNKVVVLEEGETVTKNGNLLDKAGEGIEDAWEGTKKGVRKAGEAVGTAGEKVGEAVKSAVD